MPLALLLIALFASWTATASEPEWIEGQHYFLVQPVQTTHAPPGKVEVIEIFSYACPACNVAYPLMDRLKASLPPQANLSYLPASWHPEEDWKNFQRAYFAAESLGLVAKTHDGVFDAIWKSGELAVLDPQTKRPKVLMPTIAEISKYYAQVTPVKADAFLAAAQSFSVDASMRQADAQIRGYQADQTPTLIINGSYRLTPQSAGSEDRFISLANWLVKKSLPATHAAPGKPAAKTPAATH
jgi:thiol:disulfide interchange protein DsbA